MISGRAADKPYCFYPCSGFRMFRMFTMRFPVSIVARETKWAWAPIPHWGFCM
jgi:hypothetical protein